MGQDSNYIYGAHTAFARYAEGSQTNVGLNVDGSLKVNQTLPPKFAMAAAGRLYVASAGTHAGIAPVQAVPTTAAAWALYNGNATGIGGLSLLVYEANFWVVSGTTGVGASFFTGVSPTVQASAVAAVALSIVKSSSGSPRATAATLGVNVTLAGTPAWMCRGGLPQLAAASQLGLSLPVNVKFEGGCLIPAGFAMGLTVLSPAGTTPLYGVSVEYAEVESYLV